MKVSTIYTIIASVLFITGLCSIICSFAILFSNLALIPEMLAAASCALFVVGAILIWGATQAGETASRHLNTTEHPQWIAQQARNEEFARELKKPEIVEINGTCYTVSLEQSIEAFAAAAEYVQTYGDEYDVIEADLIYESHLKHYAALFAAGNPSPDTELTTTRTDIGDGTIEVLEHCPVNGIVSQRFEQPLH